MVLQPAPSILLQSLFELSPRRNTGFKIEDLGINGMFIGGPDGRPPTGEEVGFPLMTIAGARGCVAAVDPGRSWIACRLNRGE